jgi:preprotein translocase subunit SecG
MQTILTILQVVLSLGLIGLVLIQHGRGADAGAAFGSGASATVFGARGSGSFLSRATGILAALFFLTSMALAYYAAQGGRPAGLMDGVAPPQVEPGATPPAVQIPTAPAVPVSEVPVVPMGSVAQPRSGADVPVVAAPAPSEPASGEGAGGGAAGAPAEDPKSQ